MNLVRLFSGADGESHFEQVPLAFTERGGALTPLRAARGIQFRLRPGTYRSAFHAADAPHYVLYLEGGLEIEVGDGSTHQLRAGDALLVEDLTGRGHRSRALDGRPVLAAFIAVA
ncbi:MAG: hypothetical protein HY423_10530 [Candidatus Lambdaproteobacteria bacterium]|nr:hypothetical protein [Candidatus Lambdaproteobacteria bacterium]